MVSLHTYALCALTTLGFMAPATAVDQVDVAPVAVAGVGPGGTITVPGQLTVGSSATINYSNSSRPNETITIDIDNGVGETTQVQIETDANGDGSTTWIVPEWDIAVFNGPEANAVTEVIQ